MKLHSLVIILLVHSAFAQNTILERAASLELQGQFKEAETLLKAALRETRASSVEARSLAFELDRIDRIRKDYPLTQERLFMILSESIRELGKSEFEQWVAEDRFDSRTIDGIVYFMGSSRSNLFFRYPELASRRINPPDDIEFERSALTAVETISAEAKRSATPFVLPKRFRNTMTVTLKPDAIPAGETVRAWLPIPREFPHQKEFRLVRSSGPVKKLDHETSTIRSAYLEQRTESGAPTVFTIEYEYTGYGVRFDLNPDRIELYARSDGDYRKYTAEGPHVTFTERIRKLSDELAGNDPNPLVKAKRFYDWISGTIKYSYALEYSTIRNISEYCAQKGYGDCGQAALLFITLCRYNGIPARWQSGWLTIPGGKTIHDWTEIFIPPYGWIPVDPYMGVFAMQYFRGPDEQRKKIRDFYFGGLDQYRMAANSDHNQELVPPKRSFRSDNVDFQRGELEYGESNIYFDKYSYKLDVQEVKSN
jgi:transglutaminase-like putative cysteine protease